MDGEVVGAPDQQTNTTLVHSAAVLGLLYAVVRTVLQWSFASPLHGVALPVIAIISIIVCSLWLRELSNRFFSPSFGWPLAGIFALLAVTWFLFFSADFILVRRLLHWISPLVVWSFSALVVVLIFAGVPPLAKHLNMRALVDTQGSYYVLACLLIVGPTIYAYSMAVAIPFQDWVQANKYFLIEYPANAVFHHSVTNPGASSLLLLVRGLSYFLIWLIWVCLIWFVGKKIEDIHERIANKWGDSAVWHFFNHLLGADFHSEPEIFNKAQDLVIFLWWPYVLVKVLVWMHLIVAIGLLWLAGPFFIFSWQLEWIALVTAPF